MNKVMKEMKEKNHFRLCLAALVCTAAVMLSYSALWRWANGGAGELSPALSPADITSAQQMLTEGGFYTGEISGRLDEGTARAVRHFQLFAGMNGSGVLDEATFAALQKGSPVLDEAMIDLLARFIWAETDGGNWAELISCGSEVMHRVEDPGYADTIAGVIFQWGGYESVTDGRVWKDCSQRARMAAADILLGMR